MQMKTYTARDMRHALRMIREEQGPDAVILSTRQIGEGIEVCVALEGAAPEPAPLAATAMEAPVADFAQLLAVSQPLVSQALGATPPAEAPFAAAPVVAGNDAQLGAELRSMRHLLEWQMSCLAWNDFTRRAPAQAQLLKELTEIGLAAPLANELVAELPPDLGIEEAQRRLLAQLTRRVPVTGDTLLERGGRIALVGPTGVGKTTMIAKLAARWVKRQGTRDIVLICIDDQRFGAHEQLRVLGRLLGVECLTLESAAQLPEYLARLSRHRLVLIDTAGASPRDPALADRAAQFEQIALRCGLEIWLTLSAGAQAGVLEEALQCYAAFAPRAVLLTKLDEAASLGGTLSALVAAKLPLAYVSEGARIPEDLMPARAHQIVSRAVALARVNAASAHDDLLARRFGSRA